jgi:type IV secretion system protein TrbL
MSSALLVGFPALFSWGDPNPLHWLGDAATEAVGQTWTAAMVAAWSSGLWILGLAFRLVDAFTSPDLTASGPMRAVYPYTFGLGLVVALVMAFAQIGAAAFKRDGQSVARVLVGVVQFAAVWVGYVGVAAALVSAASGLTHGLLHALLGIDGFAGYRPGADWPRDVTDTTTATVLGICAWLLIWPASIAYLLIMLVREAALLLLAATSPIAAGGLMSEMGRTWFWRSLRWFLAAVLIAPLAALVLGVGEKISEGVVSGAGADTAAAVGMAVVGCLLVLVGAICPLILFRLLAFVDPGTSSGAAMRSSLAAHGGVAGLLTSTGSTTASGMAATQGDGAGRSAGEASADSTTSSRFAMAGGMLAGVGKMAQGTVAVGSDVLASAGIGHTHPYYPQYSAARSRGSTGGPIQRPRPTPDGEPEPTGSEPDPPPPAAGGGPSDAPIARPGGAGPVGPASEAAPPGPAAGGAAGAGAAGTGAAGAGAAAL